VKRRSESVQKLMKGPICCARRPTKIDPGTLRGVSMIRPTATALLKGPARREAGWCVAVAGASAPKDWTVIAQDSVVGRIRNLLLGGPL
jgi:hypothetical protein